MAVESLLLLTAGVFIIALLYSSVGHAGASGYIAVMSLLSLAPAEIKPIALALNILVASIGSFQFWRAGHFSWSLFWPFAVAVGALRVPRRLPQPADARLQGHRRDRPACLGRAVPLPPAGGERAASPGEAARDGRGRGTRAAFRPDRHGWRHLPDSAADLPSLGEDQDRVGDLGAFHPAELDLGPAGQFQRDADLPAVSASRCSSPRASAA